MGKNKSSKMSVSKTAQAKLTIVLKTGYRVRDQKPEYQRNSKAMTG